MTEPFDHTPIGLALFNAMNAVKDSLPASRDRAIILTKLDEAYLWARASYDVTVPSVYGA